MVELRNRQCDSLLTRQAASAAEGPPAAAVPGDSEKSTALVHHTRSISWSSIQRQQDLECPVYKPLPQAACGLPPNVAKVAATLKSASTPLARAQRSMKPPPSLITPKPKSKHRPKPAVRRATGATRPMPKARPKGSSRRQRSASDAEGSKAHVDTCLRPESEIISELSFEEEISVKIVFKDAKAKKTLKLQPTWTVEAVIDYIKEKYDCL